MTFTTKKRKPKTLTPAFNTIAETPVGIEVLFSILSLRRSARSEGDEALVDNYLMPLNPDVDTYGNLFVTVGEGQPTVAFTAHTDTVHGDRPNDPGPLDQQLAVTGNMLELADPRNDDCLGADDGTGIWILLNMIKAGVPGLYCFFRDEEIGRLGSEWSAEFQPQRYDGIDIMLSFDRKGTKDIITHQMGERCCSELFAEHLSSVIRPSCSPDPTGSFTDSYSFIGMISECTNVCVGYYDQHTPMECQDLTWATYLVNQLIDVDWNQVPVTRDPTTADAPINLFGDGDLYDINDLDLEDILALYPSEVAHVLESQMGITRQDLINGIEQEDERDFPL